MLAERTLRNIAADADHVVDSIRNPVEVEVLRGRPGFLLIEVVADERTRYQRMVARNRSGDASSFEEFRRQEQAELHDTDSAAQRLVATAELADVVVDNNGDLEALAEALERVVPGATAG